MRAIFKRDLRAYFSSPLGYVFIAAFLLVINVYFYLYNVYVASSDLTGVFGFMLTMMIFLVPILTMRTFSEDYKQRTDQLLLTAPVKLTGIVLGKVLAALLVFLITLAFTLLFVIVIAMFGSVSVASVVGNYVAIVAVACAFISIGVFISSLTQNQLISCVVTLGAFLGLYLFDYSYNVVSSTMAKNAIYWLSLFRRYDTFTNGIFSFADLLYYLSIAAIFIFLTVRVLEKKRWS
jgi:ABC-2 type transport system permease protein